MNVELETRNVRGLVLQKCNLQECSSQWFRGQSRRLSSIDVENPVCLPGGCAGSEGSAQPRKQWGSLENCQGPCGGGSGQKQEAASGLREPTGQEYGTGLFPAGYKEIQGSKLSMYKCGLANINNRF